MGKLAGCSQGPIGDAERQALHNYLDSIIDLRNMVEAGGRRFRSVPSPLKPALTSRRSRIDNRFGSQYLLHQRALKLAASLAGEEVLLRFQPGLDPRSVASKRGIGLGLIQYEAILPASKKIVAKHKLVGLMWQKAEIASGSAKKQAKWSVGDAYGLSADAVSKWEKACRRLLGARYVDAALSKSGDLAATSYYAAIFGAEHGSKSLAKCASAYKLAKIATGVSDKRGRKPKNIA